MSIKTNQLPCFIMLLVMSLCSISQSLIALRASVTQPAPTNFVRPASIFGFCFFPDGFSFDHSNCHNIFQFLSDCRIQNVPVSLGLSHSRCSSFFFNIALWEKVSNKITLPLKNAFACKQNFLQWLLFFGIARTLFYKFHMN